MKNTVETLINLFTVHDGKMSILLAHKHSEPYKGYWVLPTSFVSEDETLEHRIQTTLEDYFKNPRISLSQNNVFGDLDRFPEKRVIGISYVGFVDSVTIELSHCYNEDEVQWFDIMTLPKLGYDHNQVIGEAMNYLRTALKKMTTLKALYPSDFTLPEIQRIYEIVFNKEMDRRNFRKKFFQLDIIEETGDIVKGSTGRPAKLYRFKEDSDIQDLF